VTEHEADVAVVFEYGVAGKLMVVLQDEVVRVVRREDEGEKKKGDGGLQIFSRKKLTFQLLHMFSLHI
jgi:hypothetical protein